jgi:molecular chaperone HtpG
MAKGNLKINSENILPIIKKWLYSDKDIFVRELVSNACDAIQKCKTLNDRGEAKISIDEPKIEIQIDKENKTITISDNGIGMTAQEVKKYIAQLAFSGAEEFMQKYKGKDEKDQMIGHFGLGFYSAFMVSSKVEIDTLSYQDGSEAAHWSSDGSITYNMKKGKRKERGTTITLHIENDSKEYLETETTKKILSTYCSFLPFPIFLGEDRINEKEPLWLKKPSDCKDEEYLEFYRALHPGEPDPIFWVHLNVDYPFTLKGILYFPKITPRFDFNKSNIKLFCNRVFVSDNCKDLFPDYLSVLRGAIDSPDIPLNVSRSYLQMDKTVRQLSKHISKKISDKLSSLFEEDKEKFEGFWPDMETIFKLGVLHDEKFYERVQSFLLWKTSNDEFTTIESYLDRNKGSHENKVYYADKETKTSQFFALYKQKKIEMILGGGPLDTALFNFLEGKLKETKFQRIDGGIDDVILDSNKKESVVDKDGKSQESHMSEFFKSHLENIEVEAKALTSHDLPAFVMMEEGQRRMRDYFAMTQSEMPAMDFGKKTLVVNTNNKLINATYKMEKKSPELAKEITNHLFDLSLLSQKELHPDKLNDFVARSSSVLEQLATRD